jgi:hypothetical protein
MRSAWLLPLLLLGASCNGTTGYELVNFYAAARGAPDAVKGQSYAFEVGGQRVTLTQATLHVGALYLTQSVPTSGGGPAPCVLPGTYDGVFVGQVRGGGDIDLLDPSIQPLSVTGNGSTIPAVTGQVWLMHGDVNAASDPLPVLTLQGSIEMGGTTKSFSAAIAISQSTQGSSASSGLPGENQVCQKRIVDGVPVSLTLAQGGTLVLDLDPKALFANADLSQLPTTGCETALCFTDDSSNQPSVNLLKNLTSAGGLYRFEWLPPGS